nr:TrkA family potassium uptake protein [Homoserinimonas sp. OAct 916]
MFPGARPARIAEADSVVVIGLGRFGCALAGELMKSGTEVLGIDTDEEIVQSLNGVLSQVVRADATKEEALRQLAVPEFDRAVIAIGSDIQASILTASLLLKFKIPVVWAKAVTDPHGQILNQLGIHHVVYPEKDMGRRVAHLVRGAALDFIEVDQDYVLVKMAPNALVLGRPLGEMRVRAKYGVTITAYKRGDAGWVNAQLDTVLEPEDTILVAGRTADAEGFGQML